MFVKNKKHSIVLSGYFGFGNVGDEAVLAAMVQALAGEMPGVQIVILSNRPQETKDTFAAYRVEAVNRWNFREVSKAIKKSNLVISGGGSLLQDVTGKKSIIYYTAIINMAKRYNRPVMIYAQGIGPLLTSFSRKKTQKAMAQAKAITLRDQFSQELLALLKVDLQKVQQTADPVFAWQPPEVETPPLMSGKKRLVVCLRPWQNLNTSAIARALNAAGQAGWQVIFLPFQAPGDEEIAKEVAEKMENNPQVLEALTPAEAWSILGRADFVFGMRLHSLIIAAVQGIPFAAISYDPKVTAFAEEAEQPKVAEAENIDAEELTQKLVLALSQKNAAQAKLKEKKLAWQMAAQKNAEIAKELFLATGGLYDKEINNV